MSGPHELTKVGNVSICIQYLPHDMSEKTGYSYVIGFCEPDTSKNIYAKYMDISDLNERIEKLTDVAYKDNKLKKLFDTEQKFRYIITSNDCGCCS